MREAGRAAGVAAEQHLAAMLAQQVRGRRDGGGVAWQALSACMSARDA